WRSSRNDGAAMVPSAGGRGGCRGWCFAGLIAAVRGWAILIVTLLVGGGLGGAGNVYLPPIGDPHLPPPLPLPARGVAGQVLGSAVEGQVGSKQREPNRLLVKIQTETGVILATYTKRVAEVDLLVEPGDTIALALRNDEPVVDDPTIERVKRKK